MNNRMIVRWLAVGLATVVVAGCAASVAGSPMPQAGAIIGSAAPPVTVSPGPASPGTGSSGVVPSNSESSGPATSTSTSTSQTATTNGGGSVASTGSRNSAGGDDEPSTTASGFGVYAAATQPVAALPQSTIDGNLQEARRLAAYVLPPEFIDPTFTTLVSIQTLPYKSPSVMAELLPDPLPAVATRSGMITGFSSARTSADGKSALTVAAFEYPSAAAASAAVPQLAAASADKTDDTGKAAVPGFPAAAGWAGKDSEGPYISAFMAQGSMVLYAWTHDATGNPAAQQARLQKTFGVESKAVASFKPVAPAALMQQPQDPAGMIAHTVPNQGDDGTVVDGLYQAAGALHFDIDPIRTQKLYSSAGVDLVSMGRTNIFRARDAAGASLIHDSFIGIVNGDGSWQPLTVSSNAPDATCIQQSLNSMFYCTATRGRYTIELYAQSEGDLVAALNAQYALLAGF